MRQFDKMKKTVQALAVFAAVTAPVAVHATIPTEISDMFTTLKTDAAGVVTTYVIPAVALLCGLWAILRVGKKGAAKIG